MSGSAGSEKKPKKNPKKGFLYTDIKKHLRPFDIILFKGDAILSKSIAAMERFGNRLPRSGEFSHVGMVITSDVLAHEKILPGKLYVLESTFGGSLGDGVKDINDKTVLGVQIRDLEFVISAYDRNAETLVACGRLRHNPIENMPHDEIRRKMEEFCNQHVGKQYNANPYTWFSSVCPCMRKHRETFEDLIGTQDKYFCSEIIAKLYKYFGIYPLSVNEKDVVPRDIIYPWADTDPMPKIITEMAYITTPVHYIGELTEFFDPARNI